MSALKNYQNKNIIWLALVSAVAAVLFSFFSAPLLRAFAISVKAKIFWLTGAALVTGLFIAGSLSTKIIETAVFVGAIWMTLGVYNEFERRGINWRKGSFYSLLSGLLFAVLMYFLIVKNFASEDMLQQMVAPLQQALVKISPESQAANLVQVIPGILLASLFAALALGWAFEAKAARAFSLRTERVASRIRWLDFQLPDLLIWLTLSSILTLTLAFESFAGVIALNFLIAVSVAFLFQGCAVVEFTLRYTRTGPIMRMITYVLIILQLAPFIVLLGFVDYWADFRRLMRKKQKQKN